MTVRRAAQHPEVSPGLSFLGGGGELGARMRAYPWASTALGAPERWPQSLRSVVSLMLHARQAMFIAWGQDFTLLYNDAYAAIVGAKHPAALGQHFAAVWAELWAEFAPILRRVMQGEAVSFDDLPITLQRRGYPEETWFSFSYTPLHDEDGGIVGIFCACLETTGKVRSEQALRANEAELEALVAARTAELDRVWSNSRDILVVIGADGVFRAVNPAWTTILGYQPDEVVGRSFNEFIWPEDAALTQAALVRATGHDDLTDFENRYRHKDGTPRWISWRTSMEGELVYGYGRHVTAEKQQAEILHRTEEQLRQAQKMEAIGQLTGGIAHDFNNLLTAILGSIELLKTRVAQGRTGELDRYIGAAQGAANRAAALTHRLLAFSRRQTLDPKPVYANPLIAGMEELIQRTVGPSIRVETRLAGDLWPTLCDPNQLESALLNLCINARDAMPDGGRLRIGTDNRWLNEAAARAGDMKPGAYVAIAAADTGTGMTAEVKARAFDPFFTTKPIGMGTGLGLSMIYGFVQQSGGQVHIDSEPGRGSTICLYLPRYRGEAAPEDTASASPAAASRAAIGQTALVVDDEASIRMLIREVLLDEGYAALEAADGAAGLELLRSPARIDLLISDVGLPGGMNGRQMADAARISRPALKVLFITGYAEQAALGGGRLEPGLHVMTKPFAMDAIAARIREIIASA